MVIADEAGSAKMYSGKSVEIRVTLATDSTMVSQLIGSFAVASLRPIRATKRTSGNMYLNTRFIIRDKGTNKRANKQS